MAKKIMRTRTWTNIDLCCIAQLHFGEDTDLEVVETIPRGWETGKDGTFLECADCKRRWRLRPKNKPKTVMQKPTKKTTTSGKPRISGKPRMHNKSPPVRRKKND